MRVVIALGGNALLRRGEPLSAEVQRNNVLQAISLAVAPIARAHEVVVTHGNGPQIGLLALQSAAYRKVPSYPLDVLGAESEGMIGYLIELALAGELPGRDLATLLTQVEVDPADPAFAAPSKPIGPVYGKQEAERLGAETSWVFRPDAGGYRRVVPSPAPRRIREIAAIKLLLRAGAIVICAGGGGIPVVALPDGGVRGVEAVIDKDLSAALLAEALEADALLLLTDVPAVWTRWPMENGAPIGAVSAAALRELSFAPGSMAPKVAAACRFVERTGRRAGIGALKDAPLILAGMAGTIVQPGAPGLPRALR
ncbi:MAG TPA: carbamate kinase [Stellaceae bacterium]|nr:carbamate kinase [Stellaceae bacterium]